MATQHLSEDAIKKILVDSNWARIAFVPGKSWTIDSGRGYVARTESDTLSARWTALVDAGECIEEVIADDLREGIVWFSPRTRMFSPARPETQPAQPAQPARPETQPAQPEVAGRKDDSGKVLAGVLYEDFPHALQCIAEVASFGARKYARSNWLKVPNAQERYWDALHRHLLEHCEEPQSNDPESNLPHLAHAAWNALATLELYLKGNPK